MALNAQEYDTLTKKRGKRSEMLMHLAFYIAENISY